MPNMLYFGDNLDWLPKIDPESVDLIYLDPPFNSAASYNLLGEVLSLLEKGLGCSLA